MDRKPIVAGVEPGDAGIGAAVTASRLAAATGTECFLVHAVRFPWVDPTAGLIAVDTEALNQAAMDGARNQLRAILENRVSDEALRRLEIRFGPAGQVISDVARERRAGLIVVGGKHHTALGRLVAGSTAHHLIRTANVPVLVMGHHEPTHRRILAAVDMSSTTGPTIAAAQHLAALLGAKLRVLHVVEPFPRFPEVVFRLSEPEYRRQMTERFEKTVWSEVDVPDADRIVVIGSPLPVISDMAKTWNADLVVVGSHGHGWVDRLLIGSVTEQLLNELPASLLVIPASAPAKRQRSRMPRKSPAGKSVKPAGKRGLKAESRA